MNHVTGEGLQENTIRLREAVDDFESVLRQLDIEERVTAKNSFGSCASRAPYNFRITTQDAEL